VKHLNGQERRESEPKPKLRTKGKEMIIGGRGKGLNERSTHDRRGNCDLNKKKRGPPSGKKKYEEKQRI